MEWKGSIYIETCLLFGLRSTPKLFNILADLLEWILVNQGATHLLHYDDFLTLGPPGSPECHQNLELLIQVCHMLGIPLATKKVESPTTCLDFLGIQLGTTSMEARLPEENLIRTRTTIQEWLNRKSATKREILSLVGLLQHAAKVVCPGCTFVSHMYTVAAKGQELGYYTRLNKVSAQICTGGTPSCVSGMESACCTPFVPQIWWSRLTPPVHGAVQSSFAGNGFNDNGAPTHLPLSHPFC